MKGAKGHWIFYTLHDLQREQINLISISYHRQSDIEESLSFFKLTIMIFDTGWSLSAVYSPYKCMQHHFIKVAYFHYKNFCSNSKFCKILQAKKFKKAVIKNILNRKTDWKIRPKKEVLFQEISQVKKFLLLTCPHSWLCIKINIFVSKKIHTNRNRKQKKPKKKRKNWWKI